MACRLRVHEAAVFDSPAGAQHKIRHHFYRNSLHADLGTIKNP